MEAKERAFRNLQLAAALANLTGYSRRSIG
jgi:hypothetical protein